MRKALLPLKCLCPSTTFRTSGMLGHDVAQHRHNKAAMEAIHDSVRVPYHPHEQRGPCAFSAMIPAFPPTGGLPSRPSVPPRGHAVVE